MTKQVIDIGESNDTRSGDPLRTAFTKINDNFGELYTFTANNVFFQSASNVAITSGNLTLPTTQGTYFYCNLNATVGNVIISNLSTSGTVATYTIEFSADGTPRTITWPSYWHWKGNIKPSMSSTVGNVDIITVTTRNTGSGNVWFASNTQGYYGL